MKRESFGPIELLIAVPLLTATSWFVLESIDLRLAFRTDFSQFYYDIKAISLGGTFYDLAEHRQILASALEIQESEVYLKPPAYPPWYYLSFSYFSLLSLESAGRLFAAINTVLISLALWMFLTPLSLGRRAFFLILTFTTPPVLAQLILGQQTGIVLFGASIILLALQQRNSWLASCGFFY